MNVLNLINSDVGKNGSIGQRMGYLMKYLDDCPEIRNITIARHAEPSFRKKTLCQGFTRFLPKILNCYRIFINNKFQYREFDVNQFDKFCLRKLLKISHESSDNPKLLHAWEPCLNSIKYAKKEGYKIVLDVPIAPTLHSKILDDKNILGDTKLDLNKLIEKEIECFRLVDHFIAPSKFVCDVLQKYKIAKEKISIVNFGVKSEKFNFDRKYSESGGVKFCFAGAINRRKGIKYLLEAFDDPVFENDELHLCGRLFNEQRELIKKINLNNLKLPGIINTADYFRKCDIYVFPSLMEGSSKSIFEAMASGMPIITTNYSGSIISNYREGFIVPAGNAKILRQKMFELKYNLSLCKKMGEASQSLVSYYTWEKYARSVVEVYNKIIYT